MGFPAFDLTAASKQLSVDLAVLLLNRVLFLVILKAQLS